MFVTFVFNFYYPEFRNTSAFIVMRATIKYRRDKMRKNSFIPPSFLPQLCNDIASIQNYFVSMSVTQATVQRYDNIKTKNKTCDQYPSPVRRHF